MTSHGAVARAIFKWLVFALLLGRTHVAFASSFSIDPTRIMLSAKVPSAVVTLRNESDEPVRFQLSVYAWNQNPLGQMDLNPTEDIVFFPPLLSIAPREERRIRVGAATGWAQTEKSYRLFIDELPRLKEPETGAGLRMLTRMGIPIFLRPDRTSGSASLEGLGLGKGGLEFTVRNTGNVHFIPDKVLVKAVDETGAVAFEQRVEAWYVLAGGSRIFQLNMAPPACARTRSVSVEVQVGESVLRERLETPSGSCSPSP